jgi:hypothetical protein
MRGPTISPLRGPRLRQRSLTIVARARGAAIGFALVLAATACSPSTTPSEGAPSQTEPAVIETPSIELIGTPGFGFEDFALDLADLGYTVSDDAVLSGATDLVIVAVDFADGPMRQMRDAIRSLAGSVVPRVAIALIDVPSEPDPEIEALIVLETVELLRDHGLAPVDTESIIRSPASDITSVIDRHLRRAPRNYEVTMPDAAPPAEPDSAVPVDSVLGVPLTLAVETIAARGLVAEVMADPEYGTANDCDPQVFEQFPEPGVVLERGSIVGLVVPPPDTPECLVPALTRAAIDARRAELSAQASTPG